MSIRTLRQLRDAPSPPWIWHGFLAPRNFTLFSAYPKTGKTTLVAWAIKQIMLGLDCLNRETRPAPLLYISEEPANLLAERADLLSYQDEWPIGWITMEPGLTWEKCIWYMKRWIHLHGECIIVTDTLARFWNAADENNATQVEHALRPVLELIRSTDTAFLGIHHNRKQGGGGGLAVRGSTALTGGVDIIMELTRTSPYDKSPSRRLHCESRYSQTPNSLQIRLTEEGFDVEDEEILELEPRVISVLQTLERITVADFLVLMGDVTESTLRRALNSLVHRSIISRSGTGTSRAPFIYSLNAMVE